MTAMTLSRAIEQNPTRVNLPHGTALPCNPAAERSVLSAMLLSKEALQDCAIGLTEDDFYSPAHTALFTAMRRMFEDGITVDPVTLADRLRSSGELDRVGGQECILDLSNDLFAPVAWHNNAACLKRDATLRSLASAAAEILAEATSAPESADAVVDKAVQRVLAVKSHGTARKPESAGPILHRLREGIIRQYESGKSFVGVPTGFRSLDEKLLGLRPGQMVVIGGRPSTGKTSLASCIALNAVRAGTFTCIFSLEMSKEENMLRLLSGESGISVSDLRSAKLDGKIRTMDEAMEALRDLPLVIDDTSTTTVPQILAKARRMLDNKKGNALVIIDYLQLLSLPKGEGRYDNRTRQVGMLSRGIKLLAKDLEVPVVVLSQLSRALETRDNRRPQLSDLRETGDIEQDADVVILLDKSATPEEARRIDRPDEGVVELIIAKQRNGETGTVPLRFDGCTTRFVEDPSLRPISI